MSQFWAGITAGDLPPSVPTSFVTDSGTAVPIGNVLNVLSQETSVNNFQGIMTTGAGDTVTINLTNRLTGFTSTVGAVSVDVITFPLTNTQNIYTFQVYVTCFEVATNLGCGWNLWGTIRTDGITATLIKKPDKILSKDSALIPTDANITVSGNNAIINIVGQLTRTLRWGSVATYSPLIT